MFLIFLAALAVTNVLNAQDSLRYSTLSLSVGANNISNKDVFQYPYTYRGTNVLINSIYTHVGIKGWHSLDVMFSLGQLKPVVAPHANGKLLCINYDYLINFKRKIFREKISPFLGVGLHTLLSSINYLPSIEEPNRYLSSGSFLTLSGSVVYHLTKKSGMNVQVGVPIFGLVYRPDFEINGKTLSKTTLVGKGSLFSMKLLYDYKLTSSLYFNAAYTYTYFTFDEPRPITVLQNGFTIGLRKTF